MIRVRGTGELGTVRFGSVRLDLPHRTPQTGRFGDLSGAGSTAPRSQGHPKSDQVQLWHAVLGPKGQVLIRGKSEGLPSGHVVGQGGGTS